MTYGASPLPSPPPLTAAPLPPRAARSVKFWLSLYWLYAMYVALALLVRGRFPPARPAGPDVYASLLVPACLALLLSGWEAAAWLLAVQVSLASVLQETHTVWVPLLAFGVALVM